MELQPIGIVHSTLRTRAEAPKQGHERAPSARIEIAPAFYPALEGLAVGQRVLLFTWLHQARRDTLRVHPRSDRRNPLAGVFATRSPDRPNPIGLHPVTIRAIEPPGTLVVEGLEAIDGTPVVDIKPVLDPARDV